MFYLCPALKSFMMASLSFCGISPCIDVTVKLASLIFSVSQSTCNTTKPWSYSTTQQDKHILLYISYQKYLSFCVTEDNSLCNSKRVIQITQGIKLPLLFFHCYKELLDSFQCQFITVKKKRYYKLRVLWINNAWVVMTINLPFYKDPDRVCHELWGHLKYLMGKGCTD